MATISAAFAGSAPPRFASPTAFAMTESSGRLGAEASTTAISMRRISGAPMLQKISPASEFAAANAGITSAPCPRVAASSLSTVM